LDRNRIIIIAASVRQQPGIPDICDDIYGNRNHGPAREPLLLNQSLMMMNHKHSAEQNKLEWADSLPLRVKKGHL
jgi:hypothetical protein